VYQQPGQQQAPSGEQGPGAEPGKAEDDTVEGEFREV